jgi:beta-glucuronidase
MMKPSIEGFWKKYRKPILISEFGADTIPGLHNEHNLMWSEEFQVEMINRILDISEEYPYVCGAHVWNFADFKVGQHTGRIILNWKGVFTRDRHPKMVAHEIRKRWRT